MLQAASTTNFSTSAARLHPLGSHTRQPGAPPRRRIVYLYDQRRRDHGTGHGV
jgi:hypothetical protein